MAYSHDIRKFQIQRKLLTEYFYFAYKEVE
nr:MAG TPA: hypothetical protein [Caudoviricetes sp.]